MIKTRLFNDLDLFSTHIRHFLESHEAANGLALGLLAKVTASTLSRGKKSFLATVEAEDVIDLVGFFVEHDLKNLVLSVGDVKAAPLLAKSALESRLDFNGFVGPKDIVEAFVAEWHRLGGTPCRLGMAQRIYKITKVMIPENIEGECRRVTMQDLDLMHEWEYAFCCEAVPHDGITREQARKNAENRIHVAQPYFWCVKGQPVSMAVLQRPTPRGISVGLVYTPPELRGHGYASAITAAVSRIGLEMGKDFCVLYTDLTNPTSNSIYQRIGYVPVCDSRHYIFE